jgi:hypothetical protein
VVENMDPESILNACLERLASGDTVMACLSSYPGQTDWLAPLLSTATRLRAPAGPALSTLSFSAGEARLLARAAELRARQDKVSPARRKAVPGLLASARRLVVAVAASLLLLVGVLSAGTVSAASSSLPGSPLYPVKRATEALVSSLALTPQLQTRVHLAWADRRLREIEAVTEQGGVADDSLLGDLEQETDRALAAAEQAGPPALAAAVASTDHQQTVLQGLLERAPEPAQQGLQRAVQASAQKHADARSALERATHPGPPATPPGQSEERVPPGQEKKASPTPEAAPATPTQVDQVKDNVPPAGNGQGQDTKPGQSGGKGQGQDAAHGQDKVGGSGAEQSHGNGSDKKDQPQPPGKDNGSPQSPELGDGSSPGQSGDKPAKPDNPGQSKGKGKKDK